MLVILFLLSAFFRPVFAEDLGGDKVYADFQSKAEMYRQLMEISRANAEKREAEREAAQARFAKTHVWKGNSRKARQNRTWRAEIERRAKKSALEAQKARAAYKVNQERYDNEKEEAEGHKKKAEAAKAAARSAQDAAEAQRLEQVAAENERLRQKKEEDAAAAAAAAKVEVEKISRKDQDYEKLFEALNDEERRRELEKSSKERQAQIKASNELADQLNLVDRLKGFRGSP